MLVTGSFDASVGVWRSFGLGGSAARKANTREGREGGEFGGDSEQGGNAGEEEQEGDDEEEEWQYALVLEGHDSEIKSVAFTPSGNLLATASRDKSVWIWEEVAEDEWETVAVLQEHEGDVKCVAWGPEEEVLVSASYDGEVRVWREEGGEGEWGCVGVLKVGDGGTVWWVGFEGAGDPVVKGLLVGEKGREEREEGEGGGEKEWLERRRKAGPRLLTASADCLVRVWRRVPPPEREAVRNQYSIIKREGGGEEWVVEGVLPRAHTREVYAVGWGEGGRVVSGGGDGGVVVYEERWRGGQGEMGMGEGEGGTEWVVVARVVGAHGVFEVNHVSWLRGAVVGREGEECVVSTGDDGCVRVWAIES